MRDPVFVPHRYICRSGRSRPDLCHHLTNLALHEIGHQAAASEIVADGFPDAVFYDPGRLIFSRTLDL